MWKAGTKWTPSGKSRKKKHSGFCHSFINGPTFAMRHPAISPHRKKFLPDTIFKKRNKTTSQVQTRSREINEKNKRRKNSDCYQFTSITTHFEFSAKTNRKKTNPRSFIDGSASWRAKKKRKKLLNFVDWNTIRLPDWATGRKIGKKKWSTIFEWTSLWTA